METTLFILDGTGEDHPITSHLNHIMEAILLDDAYTLLNHLKLIEGMPDFNSKNAPSLIKDAINKSLLNQATQGLLTRTHYSFHAHLHKVIMSQAVVLNKSGIVHSLLQHGITDDYLEVLLRLAIIHSNKEVFVLLVQNLSSVNALLSKNSSNLLTLTLCLGNIEFATLLINEFGCDFVVETTIENSGEYDPKAICPFLTEIITSRDHESLFAKMDCITFAVGNGIDLEELYPASVYLPPIEAAFQHSYVLARYFTDIFQQLEYNIDIVRCIRATVASDMELYEKKLILIMLNDKFHISDSLTVNYELPSIIGTALALDIEAEDLLLLCFTLNDVGFELDWDEILEYAMQHNRVDFEELLYQYIQ